MTKQDTELTNTFRAAMAMGEALWKKEKLFEKSLINNIYFNAWS